MQPSHRSRKTILLFLLLSALLLNCNTWVPYSTPARLAPGPAGPPALAGPPAAPTAATLPAAGSSVRLEDPLQPATAVAPGPGVAGEPAGCLAAGDQASLRGARGMLDYASQLLDPTQPLAERILTDNWNAYTRTTTPESGGVFSLGVDNVENKYNVQRMMNALQVAGFVTWLRQTGRQQIHILAIPLSDPGVLQGDWAPYIQPYWQSRAALPGGDPDILPALKLPPCDWMVAGGYAPRVDGSWWASDSLGWPDYETPAEAYLAADSASATRVARRIDWLAEGLEGSDTMCGPLAWSILHDAGVFPPGWGGWFEGPRTFWLAKPSANGRPWSLFPKESYHAYAFHQPLGEFDFNTFPLYPGDFLYLYSHLDGFDHMLVVTDVDSAGNVYTVTNLIQMEPERKISIEKVQLINYNDPTAGIGRNRWAKDRVNGRTGHAGFEVFRWAWMEKDISGQAQPYLVQPGDSLGLISAYWRTPAGRIAEYNSIAVDAPLRVGQALSIPPVERSGR